MTTSLVTANRERNRHGAARQVVEARRILESGSELPRVQRRVLLARINFPHDPLSVLAARVGMTKDAYWAHLRRALAGATR